MAKQHGINPFTGKVGNTYRSVSISKSINQTSYRNNKANQHISTSANQQINSPKSSRFEPPTAHHSTTNFRVPETSPACTFTKYIPLLSLEISIVARPV